MTGSGVIDGLYDPRRGDPAIGIESLRLDNEPFEPPRTNCFTAGFIESGSGTVRADASQFAFGPGSLLFFVPYQHIRFDPDSPVRGDVVRFHANFLCVETFHAEVGCSGVLFNDPYGVPVVTADGRAKSEVRDLIDRIRREHDERDLAFAEVMLAHLKVLLILSARLKASATGACGPGADLRHPILVRLRGLIEEHYRTLHSPADYARLEPSAVILRTAVGSSGGTNMGVRQAFELAARMDKAGVAVTRLGLIVVLLWIGGLKAFRYEADGIVPFVANSPMMSFLYADPENYKAHKNPEGALVPANRAWHEANRTYLFAYGLGTVIVLYGLLLCLHPWLPQAAAVGSFLVFVMSLVTLSFLVTTPECWVPALGDDRHGFPYLSGAGRLVVKDAIMMGAALVTMADSAKAYLRRGTSPPTTSTHIVSEGTPPATGV